jgi:long-chain acyl-CoA synthetase
VDATTLPQLLAQSVAAYGDRMAFRAPWGNSLESITFNQLGGRAAGAAEALAADVEAGDFVLIGARNSLPWVIGFWGVIVRGAIPVPVDSEMPEEALTSIVGELQPAAVIGDDEFLERVAQIKTRRISLDEVHDWPEVDTPLERMPDLDPEGLALLLYTGGTTGRPKGVMLSHRNLLAAVEATADAGGLTKDDVLFVILPLFHVYPLTTGCLTPIATGVPVELEYRLLRVATRMVETPPTIMLGVPALFETLVRQIERGAQGGIKGAYFAAAQSLSRFMIGTIGVNPGRLLFRPVGRALGGRLRYMVSGGARLDPTVHRQMMALGLPVIQGYGLSESVAVVSGQRFIARDYWWRAKKYWNRIGSVGWSVLGVDITTEERENTEPGEGELVVRAPNVMMGYYERPAETAVALRDGALYTGDIARIDPDGTVWITGRSSLVISMPNGKQVNLETFEAELGEALEVAQVRLTVELEPEWKLVATVFPSSEAESGGAVDDTEDLQRAVRAAIRRQSQPLPSWLRVDEIRLIDQALPVTRLGKLRRVEIPDRPFEFNRWREAAREAEANA